MKYSKIVLGICAVGAIITGLVAADHIEAPAVAGGTSDITDIYAFQGEDSNNVVLVANVQGLISPAETGDARFDETTMIEFNIDTNGDNIEDFVLQAIPREGVMYFFGPTAPAQTGRNSQILTDATQSSVSITPYGSEPNIGTNEGMSFFAGPRDDPFFMDFAQYSAIISGGASGFNDPGADTFAGTNVLSVVAEIPKSSVGGTGTVNVWVTSNRKR
ncbi:MAG: DUF4331 family protein [Gilvibacter sp.]